MVYIDDFNSVEKIRISEAQSHITVHKRKLNVLAQQSEVVFGKVKTLASEINMRVNAGKTQLLCVHASKNNDVKSYIRNENEDILSGEKLKILGFNFNSEPNANFHVNNAIDKFYGKLWTLRFLKRSGMGTADLLKVYQTVILPSVEYSSVVYGSMIPEYVSNKLESVQKQAIKIIYGWTSDYDELIENGEIKTLKDRRVEATLKFALKAASSSRFGNVWFTRTPDTQIEVRPTTRKHYVERFSRTERGRNSPVNYMTRLLNEHYGNLEGENT